MSEAKSCLEYWAGQEGDDYTRRNWVDWQERLGFWDDIIDKTGVRSVLEVGCNAGWNLSALKLAYSGIQVVGTEINYSAYMQATTAGLTVHNLFDFRQVPGAFEMVFTSGVLIHVEPSNIIEMMQGIRDKALRWVLAIEYEAAAETEIEYRGERGRLWKRPYGAMYEALGMRCFSTGDAGPGWDRCTYWLMERK